ncbi:MAG: phage major capsid protein [Defluviitaleaceae bacterium]|nr:phage major capsid protein [Defluviitaleaceae bacterium]
MNLKELHEKRNAKVTEMEAVIEGAKKETRNMNEGELAKFAELEAEIESIDKMIASLQKLSEIIKSKPGGGDGGADPEDGGEGEGEGETEDEKRAKKDFAAFIRGDEAALGMAETRADAQSTTLNGNIIPQEFSRDIIRKVEELSGVFSSVTKINSTGVYKQIVEKNKITAGWTPELAEVMKSTADFDILEIRHFKLGALVKLSFEIINQAEFDIVSEVTNQMVDAFTLETERAVLMGDGNQKPHGLLGGGTAFTLAAATAITADEIVKIYHTLLSPFTAGAKWIMNRETLLAVRLLKDTVGRYLFAEGDLSTHKYAGYILGKPVVLSEVMPANQILFGDFSKAYKANVNPGMTIQTLNELYATQGARGILGFMWFDGRPVNNQAYITAKAAVSPPGGG